MQAVSGFVTKVPGHEVPRGSSIGGLGAVHELRRTRRRNRLADLEWFEALYRVYIAAFVGGGTILFLAGFVEDVEVSATTADDVLHAGPAWLGLVAAVAFALGVRGGANGGPLSLEAADVSHVLLAPVDRRRALLGPAVQRVRSLLFAGAVTGAAVGVLADRRLPGTGAAWALAGAGFGSTVAALYAGGALAVHGIRLRRWLATLVAGAAVLWQVAAALTAARRAGEGVRVPGPADVDGSLALWAMRVRWVDLVAPLRAIALIGIGLALLGGFSLEALARRSALVSQLRFAVTLQDLRTVMLLRRQLSQERTRTRPWFRLARQGGSPATWRRSWHSLLRFPAARVVRLVVLAAVAAACQVAAFRGTTAAVVGTGLALFVLGLELAEPLSQEIDQPDRAESLPVQRGVVHLRLLAAPALSAAAFAVVGAAVVFALEPGTTTLAVIAVLALPVTLAGAAGAIVNIVSGAPDPYVETAERNLMPPEVAGTATMVKAAWPLALSIAGSLPVLAVRAAYEDGQQPVAAALRTAIGAVLLVAAILTWVRFRDDARRWWRSHLDQARHAGAGGARR